MILTIENDCKVDYVYRKRTDFPTKAGLDLETVTLSLTIYVIPLDVSDDDETSPQLCAEVRICTGILGYLVDAS